MKWRTYTRPPGMSYTTYVGPSGRGLPRTRRKPAAPSAYRVRFKCPCEGSRAVVLMACDASGAMRSAAELYPGEVLLGVRLLEQW